MNSHDVLTENSVRSENAGVPTIREIMVAKRMGADVVPNFEKMDVIAEIKRLRDRKGVDVAIKALEGRILEATRRAPTGGATDWCTR